ncbi:hypothetical protein COLO4_09283 [Corchorus olitorius]|uniref:SUEL-type lectin domain-containing protein n=1 Tax=Corchorus olitorius TaxID=93759 RepID=A0A1R3KCJ3_9ROSI|nr:hypothetical protein COLO4_09283 [Corchorus olitorius]
MAVAQNIGVPWIMCQQENAPQPMLTTYSDDITGERFCLLSNVNDTQDANIDLQQDGHYFVPAWSVTLLGGCNKEIYNTAKNYGAFFDTYSNGVTGPVGLTDKGQINIDLSSNTWNYKTIFTPPSGTDPVVLDLLGMGKGHAWVNGNSLGRFWPSKIADSNGCDEDCNYRGIYKQDVTLTKCVSDCGNPSQRWYHIPRSFLNCDDDNTLILFEEMGGNPSQVSFQTVSVGSVCASVDEGSKLEVTCQAGKIISEIKFASFGDPKGTCYSLALLQQGSCHAPQTMSIVEQACVGRETCSIDVSAAKFGSIDCGISVRKRLAVHALCENEILFYKKLKLKKLAQEKTL